MVSRWGTGAMVQVIQVKQAPEAEERASGAKSICRTETNLSHLLVEQIKGQVTGSGTFTKV